MSKAVEKADGAYTKEDLENVLDDLDSSFSYSIDGNQLTLTEREYGNSSRSSEMVSDKRNLKQNIRKSARLGRFHHVKEAKIIWEC